MIMTDPFVQKSLTSEMRYPHLHSPTQAAKEGSVKAMAHATDVKSWLWVWSPAGVICEQCNMR